MNNKNNTEFTFEIVKRGCVIGERKDTGFVKELNYVSFRGANPKWDIREWNKDHTRMSKGITLNHEEMQDLMRGIQCIEMADAVSNDNSAENAEGLSNEEKGEPFENISEEAS